MQLPNIRGRSVYKNVERFRINWDAESKSKIQFAVKQFLKQYWFYDRVYEEFPVFGTKLHVDIFNYDKKVAVEIQGSQHYKFNAWMHNNSRTQFFKGIQNDARKRHWIEAIGYTFVEILDTEVAHLSVDLFKQKFNLDL